MKEDDKKGKPKKEDTRELKMIQLHMQPPNQKGGCRYISDERSKEG